MIKCARPFFPRLCTTVAKNRALGARALHTRRIPNPIKTRIVPENQPFPHKRRISVIGGAFAVGTSVFATIGVVSSACVAIMIYSRVFRPEGGIIGFIKARMNEHEEKKILENIQKLATVIVDKETTEQEKIAAYTQVLALWAEGGEHFYRRNLIIRELIGVLNKNKSSAELLAHLHLIQPDISQYHEFINVCFQDEMTDFTVGYYMKGFIDHVLTHEMVDQKSLQQIFISFIKRSSLKYYRDWEDDDSLVKLSEFFKAAKLLFEPEEFAKGLESLSFSKLRSDFLRNTTHFFQNSPMDITTFKYYLKVVEALMGDERLPGDEGTCCSYSTDPIHNIVVAYPNLLSHVSEEEKKELTEAYWAFILKATQIYQEPNIWNGVDKSCNISQKILQAKEGDEDKVIRSLIKHIKYIRDRIEWWDPF